MDQPSYENTQPIRPRRRRRRSKMQIFKEAYLPVIILAITIILILVFIIGSASRSDEGTPTESTPSQEMLDEQSKQLMKEADALIDEAKRLAALTDYAAAMDTLSSFSGDMSTIPGMVELFDQYSAEFSKLVPYTDMENIPHLSVSMLIADLDRALDNQDYGSKFNRNYLTTGEFKAILQELYDGGYMLVSLYDVAEKTVNADGTVTLTPGTLYLPEGKQPLLLTQVAVNYFSFMVDSNKDGVINEVNSGFASRLVLDENGKLTNEMVDPDGNTVYGDFDLIPILESFIEEHPDFSYQGARATIAVTGYDGIFGYRTDPETADKIGQEFYEQQLTEVKPVIEAIRAAGYDIACNSYDNEDYGDMTAEEISADLALWEAEVTPLLGDVDIMIYKTSDITSGDEYSGEKYDILKDHGFTYFIKPNSVKRAWGQLTDTYFRQTRRHLTPTLMEYSYSYFDDLFYGPDLLDSNRGDIPY